MSSKTPGAVATELRWVQRRVELQQPKFVVSVVNGVPFEERETWGTVRVLQQLWDYPDGRQQWQDVPEVEEG